MAACVIETQGDESLHAQFPHFAERLRRVNRRLHGGLLFGASRFEPASHFITGVVEHKKAIGGCVGILESHLGKPPPAGFHESIQVLNDTMLYLNGLSFVAMNNPVHAKIFARLFEFCRFISFEPSIRNFRMFSRI
jgi:hypothetical protein